MLLHRLEKAYPKDTDVKRLISDIHWWQGTSDRAVLKANKVENLNPWDRDPEEAIHFAEESIPGGLPGLLSPKFGNS